MGKLPGAAAGPAAGDPPGVDDDLRRHGRALRAHRDELRRHLPRPHPAARHGRQRRHRRRRLLHRRPPGPLLDQPHLHDARRYRAHQVRDQNPRRDLLRRHRGVHPPHRRPQQGVRDDVRGDGLRPHDRQRQPPPDRRRQRPDEDVQGQGLPDFPAVRRHQLPGDQHPPVPGHHPRPAADPFRPPGDGDPAGELLVPPFRLRPLRRPGPVHVQRPAPARPGFPGREVGRRRGEVPGGTPALVRPPVAVPVGFRLEGSREETFRPEPGTGQLGRSGAAQDRLSERPLQCKPDPIHHPDPGHGGLRVQPPPPPERGGNLEEIRPGARLLHPLLHRRPDRLPHPQGRTGNSGRRVHPVLRPVLGRGHFGHETGPRRRHDAVHRRFHISLRPDTDRCVPHLDGHPGEVPQPGRLQDLAPQNLQQDHVPVQEDPHRLYGHTGVRRGPARRPHQGARI